MPVCRRSSAIGAVDAPSVRLAAACALIDLIVGGLRDIVQSVAFRRPAQHISDILVDPVIGRVLLARMCSAARSPDRWCARNKA